MKKDKYERKTRRTGEEQLGYTIDNSELYVDDPSNANGLERWGGAEAKFDSIFRELRAAAKSASDSADYVGESAKRASGDTLRQEIFVRSDSMDKVSTALDYEQNRMLAGAYGNLAASSTFMPQQPTKYEGLELTRRILGDANRVMVDSIAAEHGYDVRYSKDKENRDYATIKYRAPSDVLAQYEQEHADWLAAKKGGTQWQGSPLARLTAESRYEKEVFGDVFKSSDRRAKIVDAAEEQKQQEKQAKEQKKEEDDEEKEKSQHLRELRSTAIKILAGVGAVVDLSRRILSAVMDLATRTRDEGNQSRSVGVSYTRARQYAAVEEARGLPGGTYMGALNTLNMNFVNKHTLNQDALDSAAMLGVPKIVTDAVRGGEMKVEDLMSEIVNRALAMVRAGKNWEGKDVGFDNSLRSTERIVAAIGGEELAALFKQIALDNNFGIHKGEYNTLEEYNTKNVVTGDLNSLDLGVIDEIGQSLKELQQGLKREVDDFLGKLALNMRGLLGKVKELDIGKSAGEKLEDNRIEYNKFTKARAYYSAQYDLQKEQLVRMFDDEGVDFASLGLERLGGVKIGSAADFVDAVSSGKFGIGQIQSRSNDPEVKALLAVLNKNPITAALVRAAVAKDTADKADKEIQRVDEQGDYTGVNFNETEYTGTATAQRVSDMLKETKSKQTEDKERLNVVRLLNAAEERGITQNARKGRNWFSGDVGYYSVTHDEMAELGYIPSIGNKRIDAPVTIDEFREYNKQKGMHLNFDEFLYQYQLRLVQKANDEGKTNSKGKKATSSRPFFAEDKIKWVEELINDYGVSLPEEEVRALALQYGVLGGRDTEGNFGNVNAKSLKAIAENQVDIAALAAGMAALSDAVGHETGAYNAIIEKALTYDNLYGAKATTAHVTVSTSTENDHTINFHVKVLDENGKEIGKGFDLSAESGSTGSLGGFSHDVDLDLTAENGG